MPKRKLRKGQLVCEHLEGVSRRVLIEHHDVVRDLVGRRHGVYALYRKTRLRYVGLASNLRSRLRRHLRDRHAGRWDRFSIYLVTDGRTIHELEALIQRIASPRDNRVRGKFIRSKDVRAEMKRSIEEKHRRSVEDLLPKGGSGWTNRVGETKRSTARRGRAPRGLADIVPRRYRVRLRYKGKAIKGSLRRDGRLRTGGRLYPTPSAAAIAVMHRRSANGWKVWECLRSPGEWVPISEVRQR